MRNTKSENVISARKSFVSQTERFYRHENFHVLRCPICMYEFVSLERPIYLYGNDNYDAVDGMVRGDAIRIPFQCEAGHSGSFYFGFHKGNTFYWATET